MITISTILKKTPFVLMTEEGEKSAFFTQFTISDQSEVSSEYKKAVGEIGDDALKLLTWINKKRVQVSVRDINGDKIFNSIEDLEFLPRDAIQVMAEEVDKLNPYPEQPDEKKSELDAKKD